MTKHQCNPSSHLVKCWDVTGFYFMDIAWTIFYNLKGNWGRGEYLIFIPLPSINMSVWVPTDIKRARAECLLLLITTLWLWDRVFQYTKILPFHFDWLWYHLYWSLPVAKRCFLDKKTLICWSYIILNNVMLWVWNVPQRVYIWKSWSSV